MFVNQEAKSLHPKVSRFADTFCIDAKKKQVYNKENGGDTHAGL